MADGQMIVELRSDAVGEPIATIKIPSKHSGCVTGVVDLPVGTHVLHVRLYPNDWEAVGSWTAVTLQAILGQTVDTIGCAPDSGGGCL